MKYVDFAEGLRLPLDVVTQTVGILARKGAGKTYAAGKLAEGMLEAGAQVVVLDPVGPWYGLRLAPDGKSPAFDIPVLGGLHGDIPLEPEAGRLVAEIAAKRGTSMILDVSQMRKNARKLFVTDFAEELFHLKKANPSPLHLFVEESQVFVPQRVMKGEERMLGAFEDIVKQGRGSGIGCTLISQRPQAVNKDALNQVEMLVVLQTNGKQERKAIEEWIVEHNLDVHELVQSLPSLQRGEAWVWSPSWLRVTKRVQVLPKATYDSSATPTIGEVRSSAKLKPLDLAELEKDMAAVVERAKADDPTALRNRIRELEKQLAKRPSVAAATERVVAVPVLPDADRKELLEEIGFILEPVAALMRSLVLTRQVLEKAITLREPGHVERRIAALASGEGRRALENARPAPVGGNPKPSAEGQSEKLPTGARDMLAVLATTMRPHLTRRQLASLSGLKGTGGTFGGYLGQLRREGFIAGGSDAIEITDKGREEIGDIRAPTGHREIIEFWRSRLPAKAVMILEALMHNYPNSIPRDRLAEIADVEPTGGTFGGYLGDLSGYGLIEKNREGIRAAEHLRLLGAA